MERKIGEIFEYNGEWYQCLKSENCDECAFSNNNCTDNPNLKCRIDDRTDNCCAIFKKLEKAGEPYTHYCPSGRVICFQRYKLFNKLYSHNTEYIMCGFNEDGIVSIEIKQNKEDMEEKKVKLKKEDIDFLYNKFIEIIEDCVVKGYNIDNVQHEFGKLFLMFKDSDTKLNLKPFNLEQAKAGKPVCTRGGRKARIIYFDAKGDYPIVALIETGNGEKVGQYMIDGHCTDIISQCCDDLMMLPEKKEGWVNIYRYSTPIYETESKAMSCIGSEKRNEYIKTVKIEWEE